MIECFLNFLSSASEDASAWMMNAAVIENVNIHISIKPSARHKVFNSQQGKKRLIYLNLGEINKVTVNLFPI